MLAEGVSYFTRMQGFKDKLGWRLIQNKFACTALVHQPQNLDFVYCDIVMVRNHKKEISQTSPSIKS